MDDTRFTVSVHLLTALAHSGERLVTSPVLAKSIRTNPIVVRRLVGKLAEHGLVESFRGKTGGLRLGRKPEDITLRDVYEATNEKPLVAMAEKPAERSCPVSCSMKKILAEVCEGVEAASLGYLEKIRLSDLVAKITAPR